ncbi:DUF4180 domain-containing protein [Christensenella tenuis]|uniref:DUF4180 domain-containing protein n=1 Tax=Christensenella tenuis TaxID=2763033 RepID=A0ABR7EGE4_9FIRM|nr:DUF4180 domain-containing protein [Christensenella tenuis]MBC5648850.1 DUF4180 domain-containing protein [Christensenella tenuis]
MDLQITNSGGLNIAVIFSTDHLFTDVSSALDFMSTVQYETECTRIAVNKEALPGDFFKLSTRLAGEILQKFINYQVKFAVYGDFSSYTQGPLHDFIYESNQGNDFFFVPNKEDAVQVLALAK